MNRFLALAAFATVLGFLGILVWKVAVPDLTAVVVLTVALVAYDFATSAGAGGTRK